MAAIANDIDRILQGAAQRGTNLPSADILLTPTATAFHVTAAGANDPASITVSAALIDLEGTISFSAVGGTLTPGTANSAVLTYANMSAVSAAITATVISNGQTYTKTCFITKVLDGANGATAKTLELGATSQVFQINKAGASALASISLTAKGQNLGGTPSWTIPAGTATLSAGADASNKVLTFANAGSDSVTIQVAQDGLTDSITIIKVREGFDSINAFLTNENHTLTADSAGNVADFSGATTAMKLYRGSVDDTANWTFAFAPASNANLTYTTPGGVLTISAMAAGVNSATVTITASRAGFADVPKVFTVSKSKQGGNGTVSPSKGAALNDDPMIEDLTAWALHAGIGRYSNTTVAGSNGVYFFSNNANSGATDQTATSVRSHAVDASKTYTLTANLYVAPGNDRYMYVFIECYDSAGAWVATTWGGTKSGYTFGGFPPTGQFSVRGGDFGAGTGRPLPSTVRTIKVGVWFQYSGTGSSSVEHAAQDIRLEDVTTVRVAQETAAAAAQAKADLAETTAKAYADGIVTAEEARAIADATAKANVAQAAAEVAAAADATAKANAAQANAIATAAAAAQAKADLAETTAKAYADGIVTAEEARAIADATAKANVAQAAATAAAASDATAKANTAQAAAITTAAAAAQAKADLAQTTASAYADGIVTAAEARAIADATAKANTAQAAAQAAAAADATAKANVAAQTALWPNIGGINKPSDGATNDLKLSCTSTITVVGNTAEKTSGAGLSWDAQVTSFDSFTGGAFASAAVTGGTLMLGLNTDPNTNASFDTIDHAIYALGTGALDVYRNGSPMSLGLSWSYGDRFAVIYTGTLVSYQKNGIEFYSVVEAAGKRFFFDSSLRDIGSKMIDMRFGPMTGGTIGAPPGTNVGNTPAEIIESKANGAVKAAPGFVLNFSCPSTVSGAANTTLTAGANISPTGHTGTARATWTVVKTSTGPTSQNPVVNGASGNAITIKVTGTTTVISVEVSVSVTDDAGLTRVANGYIDFNFGTT